jgi:hypothetical protein
MLVHAFVCSEVYLRQRYVITWRFFGALVDHYAAILRYMMLKIYNIVALIESKFNRAEKNSVFFHCSAVNL